MSNKQKPLTKAELKAANVNPKTGLATDYLNIFNEYIMLAELVLDGSMEKEILQDWQAIDYATHFSNSGFVGADIVLQSYYSLEKTIRNKFDKEIKHIISLTINHQKHPDSHKKEICDIKHQRDIIAAMITPPKDIKNIESESKQAQIDALFD